MSDMDHKSRFLFSVAFVLSALTTSFCDSIVMSFTVHEGIDLFLPLAPWQQGMFFILYALHFILVLFTTVFFMLATLFGVLELHFQYRKLKQTRVRVSSPPPQPQHNTPYQQRRSRGYGN